LGIREYSGNTGNCTPSPLAPTSWGAIKSLY
jgi:hypothetical protein